MIPFYSIGVYESFVKGQKNHLVHALYYKLGVLNNYCSYPNYAFIYVMNVCGHVVNSYSFK
jgi:hypothetical protein